MGVECVLETLHDLDGSGSHLLAQQRPLPQTHSVLPRTRSVQGQSSSGGRHRSSLHCSDPRRVVNSELGLNIVKLICVVTSPGDRWTDGAAAAPRGRRGRPPTGSGSYRHRRDPRWDLQQNTNKYPIYSFSYSVFFFLALRFALFLLSRIKQKKNY